MKDKSYRIVIFGNEIYREISIDEAASELYIGTTAKCSGASKFDKTRFENKDFEIAVSKGSDGNWSAKCNESVEFALNGNFRRKKLTLNQFQNLGVYSESSNNILFNFSFEINFENEHKSYDYIINCGGLSTINIGRGSDCHINIDDDILGHGRVTLTAAPGGYNGTVNNVEYGVYINGYRITNNNFKVNDYDFLMIAGYSFYIKDCEFYTHLCREISVSENLKTVITGSCYALKYPKFVLNTRIKHIVPKNEIEVLPPKEKEKPRQQGILMSLLPTLLSFAVCMVMRSTMGGSGAYMMVMMGAGVLTSVITLISDIVRRKKEETKRQETYKKYIKGKENDIVKAREHEISLLNKIYRPTSESVYALKEFSGELFDRKVDDEDFLNVVIGKGALNSVQPIKCNKRESIDCEDQLMEVPEQISEKYSKIAGVPITVNLKKANAVGCIGFTEKNDNMLKQLTLDIALRQFYGDVKLFYIFNNDSIKRFGWVKWLNHVRNNQLGLRNIVCDDESKNVLFEFLYSELSNRSQISSSVSSFNVHYIVFVYDDMGIYNHPISKFIKDASKYGFTFIFFEGYKELLPRGCNWIISLNENANRGVLINSENSEESTDFVFEEISDATANEVASLIAPIYVDEVNLESSLTKSITFYELYNIYSADELNFRALWSKSDVTKSMAAPLGVRTGNEIVTLDLHEKYDGPHGLVAGTTGAGKSEIVQAYILSMAVRFHPYEVGFVIIDWKGGGLSKQFKNLPHNIGELTSIDGENGIDRFLKSLQSERQTRLKIFKDCEVNHIDAYISKYKKGEVKKPLPHIVLVVDEFAQLKKEYKEFITEIIKIAATGRSIGIHLILATQDPGSSVDDEIKVNTNFSLCLRTASANDSNKVIKSPLAYEIKKEERGRAYLQVGNNEKFFLFQSAYSSADIDSSIQNDSKSFVINELSTWGKKTVRFKKETIKNKDTEQKDEKNKQVFAVIDKVVEYCDTNHISKLTPICYPPLQNFLSYSDGRKYFVNSNDIAVGVGIYDDPGNQYQGSYYLNISTGNTLVIGSQASGKTNMLQYIIRALSEQYTPQEINFYIMDFSSGAALKSFNGINTIGGFVTKNDDEGYKNLIKMLYAQIDYRQEIFNSVPGMCDSYKSYVEAGYTDLPLIVVLIENLTGLREKREEIDADGADADLTYLLNAGVSMGITFIVTNQDTSKLYSKYMAAFLNRVVFHCNDSSEYRNVLDKCRVQPKNVTGRALIEYNDQIFSCQMFSAFDSDNAKDRQSESIRVIRELNSRFPTDKAMSIPTVPNKVTFDFIWNNYKFGKTGKYEIPVGIDYGTIDPVKVDMNKIGSFFICGAPKTERGNEMMLNIAKELERRSDKLPVELYAIDSYERQLSALSDMPITKKYTLDPNYIVELMEYIGAEAEKRQNMKIENNFNLLEEASLIVVAIQNNDAIEAMGGSSAAMDAYKKLRKKCKEVKICFVFTDVENENLAYNSPEVLKMLKEGRKGFSYISLAELKWLDVEYADKKANRKPLGENDCFGFSGANPLTRIKTISQ